MIVDLLTFYERETFLGLGPLDIGTLHEIESFYGFIFPGDGLDSAIPISGTGSAVLDLESYGSTTLSEPAQLVGAAGQPRVWYVYSATAPAIVTFATSDTTYDTAIEVYTGPDIDHLELSDWNNNSGLGLNASIDIVVAAGQDYYVRVEQVAVVIPVAITVSWTSVDRVAAIQLSMRGGTDIAACPASLRIDALNGDPDALVAFHVDADATVIGTGYLNLLGVGNGLPVLLPALSAGPHTLHLVETAGGVQTGDIDFTVLADPATLPTLTPADVIPVLVPVEKWQLVDPAPGGEAYTFAFNPASMTTPYSPRVFTMGATSAPTQQGQPLTWEGARKATQWTFSGMDRTTVDLQAFARFKDLQHRVVLVDHDSTGYVLTIEGIDAKPVRDITHPKAQTYVVTALVYDIFEVT